MTSKPQEQAVATAAAAASIDVGARLDGLFAQLPENYLLSLVTGPNGRVAVTRRRLEVGARRLADEVLGA